MANLPSKWLDPQSAWGSFMDTVFLLLCFTGGTYLSTREHYIDKIQNASSITELTRPRLAQGEQRIFSAGSYLLFILGSGLLLRVTARLFRYRLWREVDIGTFDAADSSSKSKSKKKKVGSSSSYHRRKELR